MDSRVQTLQHQQPPLFKRSNAFRITSAPGSPSRTRLRTTPVPRDPWEAAEQDELTQWHDDVIAHSVREVPVSSTAGMLADPPAVSTWMAMDDACVATDDVTYDATDDATLKVTSPSFNDWAQSHCQKMHVSSECMQMSESESDSVSDSMGARSLQKSRTASASRALEPLLHSLVFLKRNGGCLHRESDSTNGGAVKEDSRRGVQGGQGNVKGAALRRSKAFSHAAVRLPGSTQAVSPGKRSSHRTEPVPRDVWEAAEQDELPDWTEGGAEGEGKEGVGGTPQQPSFVRVDTLEQRLSRHNTMPAR